MADKIQVYRSDFMLPLISFVLIVLVWMWILYALIAGMADTLGSEGNSIPTCEIGECPTDKVTGEKKCPDDLSQRYAYDPSYQKCQPAHYCEASSGGGYAVLNDGSTDSRGYCGIIPGTENERENCRCLHNAYCSQYISGYFKTVSGNAYVDIEGENNTYAQVSNPAYNNSTVTDSNVSSGIVLNNPANSFCTIPINWIYSSLPGCSYIPDRSNPNNLTSTPETVNAVACLQSNPCNAGVLSFITDNSSSFIADDITHTPVACVFGKLCNTGRQISIYDTKYGMNVCRTID